MNLTKEEQKYAAHLQRFIQCATVSNANVDRVDWSQFEKLHEAFREFYPHIFSLMELDEVGQAGLQFHLKGSGSDKKPLLLMAHQDVVEVGDGRQWTFDPFGGELIDGCICGRGTTDCKHLLLAEMEAVEALLAEGWRPAYDLYLSLGYSEEVYLENDVDGAEKLTRNLEQKGIRLGTVVDEGGGLFPVGDKLEAKIGVAEKSPVNFEIYANSPGSHCGHRKPSFPLPAHAAHPGPSPEKCQAPGRQPPGHLCRSGRPLEGTVPAGPGRSGSGRTAPHHHCLYHGRSQQAAQCAAQPCSRPDERPGAPGGYGGIL